MHARPWVVGTLLSLLLAIPGDAVACSCIAQPGPAATPRSPWFSASGFPTNGFFTSSLDWRDAAGRRLPLVRDEALSDALGFEVRRTAGELEPGGELFPLDDCPAIGTCDHVVTIAEGPDLVAPSAAELRSVIARIARDAPSSGTSCQMDTLELEVVGTDDVTPADELITVVYVGATAEEVIAAETYAQGFAYDVGAPGRRLVSTISLGNAEGHTRDGGPLRAAGPSCFAVALMDWAGNVGERSEPVCLDTTDPSDPMVTLVDYDPPCSGAFCAIAPHRTAHASIAVALLAVASLLAIRRSRR